MQVLAQTELTPISVIYDTKEAATTADTKSLRAAIRRFLRPVVQVVQGDTVIYKTGQFYPEEYQKFYVGLGAVVGLGIVGLLALGRATKR